MPTAQPNSANGPRRSSPNWPAPRTASRPWPAAPAYSKLAWTPGSRPWPTRSPPRCQRLSRPRLPPPRRRWTGSARTAASGTGTREIRAAADAVRLTRWLATPERPSATLAEAATRMLRSWAWADRALASIARADTSRVPRLAQVYATLWDRARSRRAQLDADFARRLAAWTEASSASDDLLLVENLLDRIARPVAEQRPPGHRRARRHDRRRGHRTRRGTHRPRRLARGWPP